MGQIIKIYDYISRYEQDIYNYPARFITLKRRQWERLKENWESGYFYTVQWETTEDGFEGIESEELKSPFQRLTERIWKRNRNKKMKDEYDDFTRVKPDTIQELKSFFLDEIFQVQLSWASSTFDQKSFIDTSFLKEWQLKFFAQRFPDTFLFLYKPVFQLKKARVEAETILVTPAEIFCFTFLEDERDSVYIASEERFWEMRAYQRRKRIINPTLALNRTARIIDSILQSQNIEFPITKILIARDGYIDDPSPPYGLKIVDKRDFDQWFQSLRSYRSPLKRDQLKVADSLLSFCLTQAAMRS